MKIIKPNAVLINDNDMTAYQKIEKCGRTCYKSEDKITPDSAVKFVSNMLKSGHTAMLEHGHIYMYLSEEVSKPFAELLNAIRVFKEESDTVTKYLDITDILKGCFVSGSFRTFINLFNSATSLKATDTLYNAINSVYPELFPDKELNVIENATVKVYKTADEFSDAVHDMTYDEATANAIIKKHAVRTVVFTCDRGVSHEFVRHRPCGFAQESTRYCNYSKDKYGNEITVIEPCFYEPGTEPYETWKKACEASEKAYFELLGQDSVAQQARSVLPNSLKTELVITATEAEWQHIVNLRYLGTTGAPHPQMVECMTIAYPLLSEISNGRINDKAKPVK